MEGEAKEKVAAAPCSDNGRCVLMPRALKNSLSYILLRLLRSWPKEGSLNAGSVCSFPNALNPASLNAFISF